MTNTASLPDALPKSAKMGRLRKGWYGLESVEGLLFALPAMLGLLIFTLGPVVVSLAMSFSEYNILKPPVWAGLSNYVTAFTDDELLTTVSSHEPMIVAIDAPSPSHPRVHGAPASAFCLKGASGPCPLCCPQ